MASDDEDVPETGAVFTFGKTRFADNLASKFWIRDDPVVHLSCGDEHSAIITAKGKLYTFGSNDWGQLGHGNTKPYTKPSVVKKLKPEKVYLVACGRNHTLVATESGKLYSFGCGGDGQLGHGDSDDLHEPKAIELFDEKRFSKLACGSDFSTAVTENGILYTWGSSSEGQNGLGEDADAPQRLYISGKVTTVACGYYHMAVVTDDGSLYTCGEKEGGKLGLDKSQLDDTSQLQKVESIKERVVSVSCGAEFTVAVTENGHVYAFGQGSQGQLGLGSLQTECETPEMLQTFTKIKAKSVACGESFSAVVTRHGNLYTFGDGRHGKLAIGDECFSNLFKPEKVSRFNKFVVSQVSCGGCHMLVTAVRKEESIEGSDSEEQAENETTSPTKPGLNLDTVDGPRDLSATWSARDKRRQKNIEDLNHTMSRTLPPVNKSALPPLNGALKRTLPILKTTSPSSDEEKQPVNHLNMSRLPKITHPDDQDSQSTPKSQSSPKPLPRGLPKPTPLAPPRALPRVKIEKEESKEESDEEDEEDEESEKKKEVNKNIRKEVDDNSKTRDKKEDDDEEEDDEGEDESEDEDDEEDANTKKTTPKENQPELSVVKKVEEQDAEEESEEEDDEDDDDDEEEDDKKDENENHKLKENEKDKKEINSKDGKVEVTSNDKVTNKSDEEGKDEEKEENIEDEDDSKTKKKKDSKEDKEKKKKNKNKEEDTKDKNKTKDETNEKDKKGKKGKNKKKDAKEDDGDTEKDDKKKDNEKEAKENEKEDTKDGQRTDKKDKNNEKDKKDTTAEPGKQKDKKSGICVLL